MPSIEYQILQCTEAKAIENAAHVQTLVVMAPLNAIH